MLNSLPQIDIESTMGQLTELYGEWGLLWKPLPGQSRLFVSGISN